ncbi:hypothetical protein [Mycobacterium uberis]|uniref:hypothetical protein n=1 Tax=Mycobacterium uberis TaxID=2162698 RepID=UPI001FB3BAA6|nr:hypothetical protein [Mycobacterium uberis]
MPIVGASMSGGAGGPVLVETVFNAGAGSTLSPPATSALSGLPMISLSRAPLPPVRWV